LCQCHKTMLRAQESQFGSTALLNVSHYTPRGSLPPVFFRKHILCPINYNMPSLTRCSNVSHLSGFFFHPYYQATVLLLQNPTRFCLHSIPDFDFFPAFQCLCCSRARRVHCKNDVPTYVTSAYAPSFRLPLYFPALRYCSPHLYSYLCPV